MTVNYNVMTNVQIINEIIKIESDAQEIIKNAKRNQSDLPLNISSVLGGRKEDYNERASARIKMVRESEEELAKEQIEQINKAHRERLDKLNKIVDENMDSWVETIYLFIVKPTEI